MKSFQLKADNIAKTYDSRIWIFKHINIEACNSSAIALTGRNGSGKSTLLKTLAHIIPISKGDISFSIEENNIKVDEFNDYIGLVSPYLNLYEEFSADEHIKIYLELKGLSYNKEKVEEYFDLFSLKTGDKFISQFSSGMKQRVKYILALITNPYILFLDEPFTNLDESGIQIVEKIISDFLDNHGAVIIASNDEREMRFCKEFVELNPGR